MTRTPLAKEVRFTVPLTPPSVNHYVKHTRSGRHYVTAEGMAFKEAVVILCRRESLCEGMTRAQIKKLTYELEVWVYFGAKERGDGDNLWKCIADGLTDARVIHSDAAVKDWHLYVRRDPKNPRTEIRAAVLA